MVKNQAQKVKTHSQNSLSSESQRWCRYLISLSSFPGTSLSKMSAFISKSLDIL